MNESIHNKFGKYGGIKFIPAKLIPLNRKRKLQEWTDDEQAAGMLLNLNKKPIYNEKKPIRVFVITNPESWNYHKPTFNELHY